MQRGLTIADVLKATRAAGREGARQALAERDGEVLALRAEVSELRAALQRVEARSLRAARRIGGPAVERLRAYLSGRLPADDPALWGAHAALRLLAEGVCEVAGRGS